jgi:hypothetical protein
VEANKHQVDHRPLEITSRGVLSDGDPIWMALGIGA